jgi:hypothetical protein
VKNIKHEPKTYLRGLEGETPPESPLVTPPPASTSSISPPRQRESSPHLVYEFVELTCIISLCASLVEPHELHTMIVVMLVLP